MTMATGVITLLLALSQGNREVEFAVHRVALCRHCRCIAGASVLIELWVGDPLVDLRLYRNATYSMAALKD